MTCSSAAAAAEQLLQKLQQQRRHHHVSTVREEGQIGANLHSYIDRSRWLNIVLVEKSTRCRVLSRRRDRFSVLLFRSALGLQLQFG